MGADKIGGEQVRTEKCMLGQATRMIRAAIDRGMLVAINRTKVVINDGKPITEVSI